MKNNILRNLVFRLVSVALVSLGFLQVAHAGMVDTTALVEKTAAEARVAQLDMLLERQDIADQLVALGVSPDDVKARVANLSDAEIAAFEQRLDSQVAGGDAIGVIGTVFLVLLILELVGVTDIFKSF